MPRQAKPAARKQPHTFPEQRQSPKRKYRVTGKKQVGEVDPGGVVELRLTPDQERVLVEAGLIAPYSLHFDASATKVEAKKETKNRPPKADTKE